MEEIMTVFNRFGVLVAVAGGGISLIMFGFAGVQYMTAQGDPQAMGRAKSAFIGALMGSAIVGLAFIIPGIISRVVIEPSGGTGLTVETGSNCDALLQNQLKFQRAASTDVRMNEVTRQLQSQNASCVTELWNPKVDNTSGAVGTGKCFTDKAKSEAGVVGNTLAPAGLRTGNDIDKAVRIASGRDSDNNIIVYWSADADKKPTDGAVCWLYVSRLNTWDENY